MKQLWLGVGLCVLTSMALAGEKVDRTLDASDDGYVNIEHLGGYATIKGWSKDQVQVKGELGDRTEKFIFERNGNEVTIKVKVKESRGWNNNWSDEDGDNLEIFVPLNSQINYTSVNANVEVSDIKGGADIDTVNGEIEVSDMSGRLRIGAVNGDIKSKNLSGDVKLETINGDIRDQDSTAKESSYHSVNGDIYSLSSSVEVKAETVNGEIELNLDKVDSLSLNTVNGSVEARLELAKQGYVKASSVGGSIELYFQKDVSARFDLQGHAGGRIVNKLSDDKVQKAKYGPSRWLEFTHNGGSGQVKVSTVSGTIKVDSK